MKIEEFGKEGSELTKILEHNMRPSPAHCCNIAHLTTPHRTTPIPMQVQKIVPRKVRKKVLSKVSEVVLLKMLEKVPLKVPEKVRLKSPEEYRQRSKYTKLYQSTQDPHYAAPDRTGGRQRTKATRHAAAETRRTLKKYVALFNFVQGNSVYF